MALSQQSSTIQELTRDPEAVNLASSIASGPEDRPAVQAAIAGVQQRRTRQGVLEAVSSTQSTTREALQGASGTSGAGTRTTTSGVSSQEMGRTIERRLTQNSASLTAEQLVQAGGEAVRNARSTEQETATTLQRRDRRSGQLSDGQSQDGGATPDGAQRVELAAGRILTSRTSSQAGADGAVSSRGTADEAGVLARNTRREEAAYTLLARGRRDPATGPATGTGQGETRQEQVSIAALRGRVPATERGAEEAATTDPDLVVREDVAIGMLRERSAGTTTLTSLSAPGQTVTPTTVSSLTGRLRNSGLNETYVPANDQDRLASAAMTLGIVAGVASAVAAANDPERARRERAEMERREADRQRREAEDQRFRAEQERVRTEEASRRVLVASRTGRQYTTRLQQQTSEV